MRLCFHLHLIVIDVTQNIFNRCWWNSADSFTILWRPGDLILVVIGIQILSLNHFLAEWYSKKNSLWILAYFGVELDSIYSLSNSLFWWWYRTSNQTLDPDHFFRWTPLKKYSTHFEIQLQYSRLQGLGDLILVVIQILTWIYCNIMDYQHMDPDPRLANTVNIWIFWYLLLISQWKHLSRADPPRYILFVFSEFSAVHTLIFSPSISTSLSLKSTPMVASVFSGNLPAQKR